MERHAAKVKRDAAVATAAAAMGITVEQRREAEAKAAADKMKKRQYEAGREAYQNCYGHYSTRYGVSGTPWQQAYIGNKKAYIVAAEVARITALLEGAANPDELSRNAVPYGRDGRAFYAPQAIWLRSGVPRSKWRLVSPSIHRVHEDIQGPVNARALRDWRPVALVDEKGKIREIRAYGA